MTWRLVGVGGELETAAGHGVFTFAVARNNSSSTEQVLTGLVSPVLGYRKRKFVIDTSAD